MGIMLVALALAAASSSPASAGATASNVVVTNTSANPVPITGALGITGTPSVNRAEDSTGLTHMRQLPSQHVTLMSLACQQNTECDFTPIRTDGSYDGLPFHIPVGQLLVVTQVDWIVRTGVPGTTYRIPLRVNGNGMETLFGIADANGVTGGSLPFNGGLIFKEGSSPWPPGPVSVNAAPSVNLQVTLLGYLIAER
jgi:hypothetical protein